MYVHKEAFPAEETRNTKPLLPVQTISFERNFFLVVENAVKQEMC